MIATGFAAGFLYDFLSAFKRGRISAALIDVAVFILTGLLAAGVLVLLSQPRVRYYDVFGLIAGGVIYALLPHRFFVYISRGVKGFFKKRAEKKQQAGECEKTAK